MSSTVVEMRVPNETLAVLIKFYLTHGTPATLRSRGTVAARALKDFASVLVKNEFVVPPTPTEVYRLMSETWAKQPTLADAVMDLSELEQQDRLREVKERMEQNRAAKESGECDASQSKTGQ